MPSNSFRLLLFATTIFRLALGTCLSSGWDFVDGGQNYFINTLDKAPFSFGTIFDGCVPEDTEGQLVYPVVVDPNENEYFCSGIDDEPDGAVQMSTCNLPAPDGPPLYKTSMISGTYYIVIQGASFSWMRTFTIIAGPQKTITATPTAIFNVTLTPSTTINTTITSEIDTTLAPITSFTTVPSTTITKVSTVTPPRVTMNSTSTKWKTKSKKVFSKTLKTITKSLTCKTQTPIRDPTCTFSLTKASLRASSANATSTAGSHKRKEMHRPRVPDRAATRHGRQVDVWRRQLLAKRAADQPTIVVVETTFIASVYNTFTAHTSTELDTYYTTVTSTITPPPVTSTSYLGKAHTIVTVTASTPTTTKLIRTTSTMWTTKTIWATVTITSKVTPNSLVCKAGATPTPTK